MLMKTKTNKKNIQNTKTNGKCKAIQTKSHTQAYTHIHPHKRRKREKYIYIVAPEVHLLNLR